MKTVLKRISFLSVLIISTGMSPPSLSAHGGYVTYFRGMGFNPAYIRDGKEAGYALNLHFRKGFFSYVSLYWHAEAGRLMKDWKWYGQIGGDAMIFIFGLQGGIGIIHQPRKGDFAVFAAGPYSGISVGAPVSRNTALFFSAGRNFYVNRRDSFYARLAILFGKSTVR